MLRLAANALGPPPRDADDEAFCVVFYVVFFCVAFGRRALLRRSWGAPGALLGRFWGRSCGAPGALPADEGVADERR